MYSLRLRKGPAWFLLEINQCDSVTSEQDGIKYQWHSGNRNCEHKGQLHSLDDIKKILSKRITIPISENKSPAIFF